MTNVYKVLCDYKYCMEFTLDENDIYEKMPDFRVQELGYPLPFTWKAPKAIFSPSENGGSALPDITRWLNNDVIVRKSVFAELAPIFDDETIEGYPVTGDGEDYVFINILTSIGNDQVDMERTHLVSFDGSRVTFVEQLILKPESLLSLPPLFTLVIDNGLDLYCNEQFYKAVQLNRFKGLDFELFKQP